MSQFRFEQLEVFRDTKVQAVPANYHLFKAGDECTHFVLVTSGLVRVELLSTTGQQLLLYRISDGQSCVMTTSCLLGNNDYFAQAVTETEVNLIMLPESVFREHLAKSPEFRNWVFSNFSERLASMMQRTAEIATYSIDQRLAAALLAHASVAGNGTYITLTHEQLAIEIGSVREVVSRRLASLENNGFVKRHRGSIEIRDFNGLTRRFTA